MEYKGYTLEIHEPSGYVSVYKDGQRVNVVPDLQGAKNRIDGTYDYKKDWD